MLGALLSSLVVAAATEATAPAPITAAALCSRGDGAELVVATAKRKEGDKPGLVVTALGYALVPQPFGVLPRNRLELRWQRELEDWGVPRGVSCNRDGNVVVTFGSQQLSGTAVAFSSESKSVNTLELPPHVGRVVLAPTGFRMAAVPVEQKLVVWDRPSSSREIGEVVRRSPRDVAAAEFSSDGETLFAAFSIGFAAFDVKSGKEKGAAPTLTMATRVAFEEGARHAAVLSSSAKVEVFRVKDTARLCELDLAATGIEPGQLVDLAFETGGKSPRRVVAHGGRKLRVFNAETCELELSKDDVAERALFHGGGEYAVLIDRTTVKLTSLAALRGKPVFPRADPAAEAAGEADLVDLLALLKKQPLFPLGLTPKMEIEFFTEVVGRKPAVPLAQLYKRLAIVIQRMPHTEMAFEKVYDDYGLDGPHPVPGPGGVVPGMAWQEAARKLPRGAWPPFVGKGLGTPGTFEDKTGVWEFTQNFRDETIDALRQRMPAAAMAKHVYPLHLKLLAALGSSERLVVFAQSCKEGDCLNGAGVAQWRGATVRGQFVHGLAEGRCEIVDQSGEGAGFVSIKARLREGLPLKGAVIEYDSGMKYEGEVNVRWQPNGRGVMVNKDGRTLQGEWRDGKLQPAPAKK